MRVLTTFTAVVLAAAETFCARGAQAQSALDLDALQGLVPFSTLLGSATGKAALASNYAVTGAIQTGTANQPGLQPFAAQQKRALEDAFITSGNALELADGLGTKLGAAYASRAAYTSPDDGKTSSFTNISPHLATLFAYTSGLTAANAASAKFFFSNETVVTKTATAPVSKAAADMLAAANGTTDVYGKAYRLTAGSKGADPFGDSRPFQTEAHRITYSDADYFGIATTNDAYLNGPTQDLIDSPSFPSGHTTYGYTESLLLAVLVPERFSQMIVRCAEYGNSRIVIGAHYAMDVIAGRTLAYYDVAHLLAESPAYLAQPNWPFGSAGYQSAVATAKTDLAGALGAACGNSLGVCASDDTSRFKDAATNEAFYESTQTYGLPVVYEATARSVEDVATFAPEAGYILKTAFPNLTLAQADQILTETEGPGGGFLDNGSAFGLYSRLDLYQAGQRASALLFAMNSKTVAASSSRRQRL